MPRPHDVHSAKDPLTDTLEASFAHRRLRPEVWLALLGCIAILVVFLYEPEPAKPKTKQPVSAVDGGSTAVSNPNVPAVPAQTDNWIGKFLKDNEADAGSTGATSEAAKKKAGASQSSRAGAGWLCACGGGAVLPGLWRSGVESQAH